MADNRTTIYLGPPLLAALEGFANRSGRLNELAERYAALIAEVTPALTKGEWCLICDILNASMRTADLGRLLWAEIEDSEPDGVGPKWGVDIKPLAAKVRAMRTGERLAILEVVDRFWAGPKDIPHRDMLDRAGARIAEG